MGHGGHQRIVLLCAMLNSFPRAGARMSLMISDDGTLHASAQHLLENFMRLREPPPYQALS